MPSKTMPSRPAAKNVAEAESAANPGILHSRAGFVGMLIVYTLWLLWLIYVGLSVFKA